MSRTGVTVTTSGFFFRGNPAGYVHIRMYDDIDEAMQIGVSAAANQLQPGHGFLTGRLQASLAARYMKAYRGGTFKSRGVVIQGAKGYELVRFYGWKIDRRYHYMNAAARAAQSYADAHSAQWADRIARGLNRE